MSADRGPDGPSRRREVVELPRPGRRAARRAEIRNRILQAAREIFFRDGFMEASLDEIATRADLGKGTLYRHFESKAELYVAVLAANGAVFEERMRGVIDEDAHALEQLRAVGDFYRRYWSERPENFGIFWAVSSQTFIGELSRPLLEEVRSIWERPLRMLEGIIEAGVRRGELRSCDPWVTAHVIWRAGNGAIEALVTPKRARVLDCSPEAIWRDTLDLVIAGMRVHPDERDEA
jgi:AcrR family transcriptional regulator